MSDNLIPFDVEVALGRVVSQHKLPWFAVGPNIVDAANRTVARVSVTGNDATWDEGLAEFLADMPGYVQYLLAELAAVQWAKGEARRMLDEERETVVRLTNRLHELHEQPEE